MSQMPLMVNVGIEFTNKALQRLASPSSCGILGYREVTSIVHNIDSAGRGHVTYLRKTCVSRMYDGILGTNG